MRPTAAATGRLDAVFFVIGGLVGAAAYMLTYADVKSMGLLAEIAGGKSTLGPIAGTSYASLISSVPGEWIGLGMGVLFMIIAWALPDRLVGSQRTVPAE